jgi:flagellar biosynthetic protein FliR
MDLNSWLDVATGRFTTGLMIFARFTALLATAPLISGRAVPNPLRVGLGGALALILTPVVPVVAVSSVPALLMGLGKEIVVGLALGWVAAVLFAAIQTAGEWLDLHAGFQVAQVLNPAFDTQNALIGNFKYLLAGLVFLGTGGHAVLIRAAATSLAVSPPGVLRMGFGDPQDWTALIGRILWLAVQMAAPVAAALFLAEIAIGLANRALPQVNLMMLTLPLKAILAVSALAVAVPVLVRVMTMVFGEMGPALAQVLRMVRG